MAKKKDQTENHRQCFRSRSMEEDKENLCADGAMRFTIASYPKEAFEVMSLMRQHQKLCDVEIRVCNEIFHAHKIVLASASPYFKLYVIQSIL
ncbi:hypothetical protein NPIL_483532 [Nephila pilipes]|uniref:BTB domain-containing protein n=1 Tax=Nephila pilipes TaxID=299642 RepID=A0A8X6QRP5_NEPPI|nr:hypothetical protein NPIL_483532 [Nephila pilipes]